MAIRFYDIGQSDWPDDIRQCAECCALVLAVNTYAHAAWHEQINEALEAGR
ncbi:hypothetical protein GCM10009555_018270 [Acrocarpospora macrocephala]|uniref:Uncharacterized protein n=1 Tax=Acrocarpospora macrocephala TaxID=150177 RepID=A0A5M3WEI9_9ACTN|nr:hypothetical protein [Acrocarpospora macrocephala]GES07487.1 hypothetical protein Amac_010820 [Acrocarpospora macrocephala]